jgi:hypothetical protein
MRQPPQLDRGFFHPDFELFVRKDHGGHGRHVQPLLVGDDGADDRILF